jgi:homotetrameric cytidine deaminase
MNDQYATDPALASLFDFARQAALYSYSPYSGFRVGAALQLSNGEIVTGCNVESASYSLSLCAERAALVRAIAQYGPEITIAAVAVTNLNDEPSPPCGACRQVLSEFIAPQAPVRYSAADGPCTVPFTDLFPEPFVLKSK